MESNFTLRKTGPAKTGAAGPFLPALCIVHVVILHLAQSMLLAIKAKW